MSSGAQFKENSKCGHAAFAIGSFITDDSVFHRNLEMPDIPVYTVKAHKEIVNCIDGVGGLEIGHGAPEIVTGSRDGEII